MNSDPSLPGAGHKLPLQASFPVSAEAPAAARGLVEDWAAALPGALAEDLKLLVSELVSNAIQHGGTGPCNRVGLELASADHAVRAIVRDSGEGFERARFPHVGEVGGWGLWLVDQVSDEWGVDEAADGTAVWFELGLPT